jgi:hypothetical protein
MLGLCSNNELKQADVGQRLTVSANSEEHEFVEQLV